MGHSGKEAKIIYLLKLFMHKLRSKDDDGKSASEYQANKYLNIHVSVLSVFF